MVATIKAHVKVRNGKTVHTKAHVRKYKPRNTLKGYLFRVLNTVTNAKRIDRALLAETVKRISELN